MTGDEFRQKRIELGYTQAELAKLIGTSQSQVAKIEARNLTINWFAQQRLQGLKKKPAAEKPWERRDRGPYRKWHPAPATNYSGLEAGAGDPEPAPAGRNNSRGRGNNSSPAAKNSRARDRRGGARR